MEFWGLEVKPGQTVSCDAGDECAIHISQVALGETKKKGSENVVVSAKVGGNKMVIGNLSSGQHPQFMCDLFIGNEFELSHSSKTTSVFLCGYRIDMPSPYESDSDKDDEDGKRKCDSDDGTDLSSSDDDMLDSFSDDDMLDSFSDADSTDSTTFDDDMDSSSTDGEDESSDDDESDKSPAEESSSSSMESSDEEDGSDGDDEDETDEEDEITKKPESSKMKAAGSIFNTPSGQKTAKEAKSNEKTRKSSDTQACKSCSKTFSSDAALCSHQKAKHPAK